MLLVECHTTSRFWVHDLVKVRCWMAARSHLRRQWMDFVWAPRGLPANSRSCSTRFAGGSIWWFTGRSESSSRLSPQQSLPPERAAELCPASSAALLPTPCSPLLLNAGSSEQENVFSECCSCSELWHIMKAQFKNKIQNTTNFILMTCEKYSQPSNLSLTSIYICVNFFPSSLLA